MKTSEKKIVAVIGRGYVGSAVERFFQDHFQVVTLDSKQQDEQDYKETVRFINAKADLAVICVPTPMSDDGSCDTSIVEQVLSLLADRIPVLIKSTVPPRTTERLRAKHIGKRIAFSPEYIGEGNYVVPFWKGYPDPNEMKRHEFVIIGGTPDVRAEVLPFFKRVLGAEPQYFLTDSTTAELVKYMENAYLATKVTFCNEFYEIAKTFDVDYDVVREMWLADGRIGRSHTAVFENERGFGGKCLPKDVNAIVKRAEQAGYEPTLLKAVLSTNDKIRGK